MMTYELVGPAIRLSILRAVHHRDDRSDVVAHQADGADCRRRSSPRRSWPWPCPDFDPGRLHLLDHRPVEIGEMVLDDVRSGALA